jgi:hypothetical protein
MPTKTRYKIVGKAPPKAAVRGDVPVDALRLITDINRLEFALELLEEIDDWSIANSNTLPAREFARGMRSSQIALVRSWLRHAKRRLRTEYLAP